MSKKYKFTLCDCMVSSWGRCALGQSQGALVSWAQAKMATLKPLSRPKHLYSQGHFGDQPGPAQPLCAWFVAGAVICIPGDIWGIGKAQHSPCVPVSSRVLFCFAGWLQKGVRLVYSAYRAPWAATPPGTMRGCVQILT